MRTNKLVILFIILSMFISGCTYATIKESISRTPASASRQEEGTYRYYILIKEKDGKIHLYPIIEPQKTEPKNNPNMEDIENEY